MARRSLSAQVIDEVDRARGLLEPIRDIVDPMTSHMVGAVLESLHRVETMCLAARQADVNSALTELPALVSVDVQQAATKASSPRPKRPAPARVKGDRP